MPESIFVWEEDSWEFPNSDINSEKTIDHEKNFQELLDEEAVAAATNSNCPTPKFTTEPVAFSVVAAATTTTITGKKRGKKSQGVDGEKHAAAGGKKVAIESEHEIHIWTERERRKRMRCMFVDLHTMLPQLPPKTDKSSIVDEAISYIKTCQETLHKLEKQKQERLINGTYNSSSQTRSRVDNNSSREAFIADYPASNIIPSLNNSHLQQQPPPTPSMIPGAGIPRFPAAFTTWVSPNVILSITGDNAHINVCCLKKHGLFTAISYFMEKYNLEVVSVQTSSSDPYRTMCTIHARASGTLEEICSFEGKIQQAAVEIMNFINSLP